MNVAAMRDIDVTIARQVTAKDLFERKSDMIEGDGIVVMDKELLCTVIHDIRCTYIVSSHGIECVCKFINSFDILFKYILLINVYFVVFVLTYLQFFFKIKTNKMPMSKIQYKCNNFAR